MKNEKVCSFKNEVLKAKKELKSIIEETKKDLKSDKSRMRPLSIESAKVLLDFIKAKEILEK